MTRPIDETDQPDRMSRGDIVKELESLYAGLSEIDDVDADDGDGRYDVMPSRSMKKLLNRLLRLTDRIRRDGEA